MKLKFFPILTVLVVAVLLVAACAQEPPTAVPATAVPPTKVPPTQVPPTEEPAAEEPCLIIGALHGGPIADAGYNQAMHESVMQIKENIPCVRIIEAENVPEEAGATSTMENMIQQGAGMIIATALFRLFKPGGINDWYEVSRIQ